MHDPVTTATRVIWNHGQYQNMISSVPSICFGSSKMIIWLPLVAAGLKVGVPFMLFIELHFLYTIYILSSHSNFLVNFYMQLLVHWFVWNGKVVVCHWTARILQWIEGGSPRFLQYLCRSVAYHNRLVVRQFTPPNVLLVDFI